MKTIHLLLTRSCTVFSFLIRRLTGAPYTHASLSLAEDPALFSYSSGFGFYSFGRKNPRLPYPAGLVQECRDGGFYDRFPSTRCVLLALEVPDDAYTAMARRLDKMNACAGIYRYNLTGALLCGLGISVEKRRRFFCSQFVADLLSRSGAAVLPKPVSLMQPMDLAALAGVRVVYTGTVGELFHKAKPRSVFPRLQSA